MSDFAAIVPALKSFNTPLTLASRLSGTSTSLRIHDFTLLSDDEKINIQADGSLSNYSDPVWYANINQLVLNSGTVNFLKTNFGKEDGKELEVLARLGDIHFKGRAGGSKDHLSVNGMLASDAGSASFAVGKRGSSFTGALDTEELDLGKITADDELGRLAARLEFDGSMVKGSDIPDIKANGTVAMIEFRNHTYRDITIDGTYRQHQFDGLLSIDDPDARVSLQGMAAFFGKNPSANFRARVEHFNPSALGLTDKWKGAVFDMDITADFDGKDADTARGMLAITDFAMRTPGDSLFMDNLDVSAGTREGERYIRLRSDFADADVRGHYNYATLAGSIKEILSRRMPSLIGAGDVEKKAGDDFALNLRLKDTKWMRMFLDIPVHIKMPVMLNATINNRDDKLDFNCSLPSFRYGASEYGGGNINLFTAGDSLKLRGSLVKTMGNGHKMDLALKAAAIEDRLMSRMMWDNNQEEEFSGCIDMITDFVSNGEGKSETRMNFCPSQMTIGGVQWFLRPSTVTLGDKKISFDNFTAENDRQHLIISGQATDNPSDSIVVRMRDMEVAYILDLVNFHSVDFSGRMSGSATVASVFG